MPTLPIVFDRQFAVPVWRFGFEQVAEAPDRLYVELRDDARRAVDLEVISLSDGSFLPTFRDAVPWRSTVLGLWNGRLLYHRLDNDRLPVPTALGCYDLQARQRAWEWPGHLLVAADGQTVWTRRTAADRFDATVLAPFRLATGQPAEEKGNPPAHHNSALRFPVSYTETSTYWPVISRFLKKVTDQPVFGKVEYLEVEDKILFSYYIHEKNSVRAYLLITDRHQTIWLHRPIADEPAAKPLRTTPSDQATFCVWQNQMITLVDPSHLISYSLIYLP